MFMNDNNMNNIMEQLNQMLNNNTVPDELKTIVDNLKNSSNDKSSEQSSNDSNSFNIDMNTMLKMKQVMDSINSNKDDPRTNLLLSLKPYLKDSRKKKVEQYIKLFGIEKAFQAFDFLGGENKNDV